MHNIKWPMIMSDNPHGNCHCEKLSCTLHGLLMTLQKQQKANWPLYIPSLVFTCNAMSHGVTGVKPYEHIFKHKATAICDAWLGLINYNAQYSMSKCTWLNKQHELLVHIGMQ